MKFLKSNWKAFALFILIGVIFWQYQSCINGMDDAIAGMMADKTVARLKAGSSKSEAKYALLNAELDKERAAWDLKLEAKAREAWKWRADSEAKQKKIKDLQGCIALLDDCQQYAVRLNIDFTAALEEADKLCLKRVHLKDSEIGEWRKQSDELIKQIGELTKALILAQIKARRRFGIGPQVGYGIGGGYVGIGLTYQIIRLKTPGGIL